MVLGYLLAIGLYLLWRGFTHRHTEREPRIVEPLGLIGGGVDLTWGDFGINMLTVGSGNVVGGGLVIGFAYAYVAGKGRAPGAAEAADVHEVGDTSTSR